MRNVLALALIALMASTALAKDVYVAKVTGVVEYHTLDDTWEQLFGGKRNVLEIVRLAPGASVTVVDGSITVEVKNSDRDSMRGTIKDLLRQPKKDPSTNAMGEKPVVITSGN